jgi:nicotinamide mononucleotide transporter
MFFESFAAIFTLIAVLLMANGQLTGWIFSIVGSVFYGVLYFHQGMNGTGMLQIIYTVQAIFGLSAWIKAKKESRLKDFSCRKMNPDNLQSWIIIFVFIFGGNYIVDRFFLTLNYSTAKFLDYGLAIASLGALILTTYRYIQCWYIWICINIGYIILCSHLNMWPSVFLNIILIFISLSGLKQWRKKIVLI